MESRGGSDNIGADCRHGRITRYSSPIHHGKRRLRMFEKQEFGRLASRGTTMLNKFVAIGLGAVIALAPLAAVAQTEQLAQAAPAATPDTSMAAPAAKHTGSHRTPRPAQGQHGGRTGRGLQPITCTICARLPPRPRLRRADRSARAPGAGRESMRLLGGRSLRPPLFVCPVEPAARAAPSTSIRLRPPACGCHDGPTF